jgi:hypothetical protein
MRICVNCGNEYPESFSECPLCGYPAWLNGYPETEYVHFLRNRFDLIRVRDGKWVLWDGMLQRKLLCRRIPAGMEGDQMLELLHLVQAYESVKPYPKLVEVCREAEEEGYYLTEDVNGITLQEIVQRQNPPDVSYTDQIAGEVYALMSWLSASPFHHGSLNLGNLVILQDGSIVPDGYGKNIRISAEEDILQLLRILLRMYSGEWEKLESSDGVEKRIEQARKRTLLLQSTGYYGSGSAMFHDMQRRERI